MDERAKTRATGDDGAFEVMTVRVSKHRSLSGSVLKVRPDRLFCRVSVTGRWVS